jgi:hypothetical protein
MSINALETRRTAHGKAETAFDSLTVYHLEKRLLLGQITQTESYRPNHTDQIIQSRLKRTSLHFQTTMIFTFSALEND